MSEQPAYVADGAVYRCGLCGEAIPDGALVDVTRDDTGALTSVIVSAPGDEVPAVVHSCG